MGTEKSNLDDWNSQIFEETQQDADRYQWLRTNLGSTLATMHCPRGTLLTLDQLDKIIDTAMGSENGILQRL